MHSFPAIKNSKILAFVSGSLLIQLVIIAGAIFYRSSAHYNTEAPLPATTQDTVKEELATNETPSSLKPEMEVPKETQINYTIQSGDTLSKIWSKFGNVPAAGLKAADAFKEAKVPLNALRVGEDIALTIKEGDIIEFKMRLPEGKSITLKGNGTDGYKAEVFEPTVIEKERTVSYPITSSFSASAVEVDVPLEIVDDLVDLFSGRIDFRRDIQPGDSFTVIYKERVTDNGERLAPGAVKAISIETDGKLYVAIGHEGSDGKVRFFNESGEQLGNNFLRYPLRFSRISSIFAKSRFHPILKISRPHNGVDFAAPTGTPVRSVADGVVEYAGYAKGTGNMVKIRHCGTYSTAYMHLNKISHGLKKGSRVSRGDVIGGVGMTGLATAPHLHFSFYKNGNFVDPLKVDLPSMAGSENSIPKTYLASTMTILRQQHELVRLAFALGASKSV